MFAGFKNTMVRFVKEEDGIQHAEEALLLALIGVAAIAGATLLGTNVDTLFNNTATCIGGGACP